MENKDKKKVDFKYDINLYLGLIKKYKKLIFILLVFALIIEAISVADKYLFKIIIDNGTNYVAGLISYSGLVKILLIVALVYISIIIIRAISKWFHIHLINRLDGNLIFDLKQKFFNHIVGLSHNFHTTHKTGSLISRLTRGGSAIERMTDTIIFSFVPLIFQLTVAMIALIYFDWVTAAIIFITMFVFILYGFINQQFQKKANIEANDAEDIEKANIGDIFANVDSIKYFGKEHFIKNRYEKLADTSRKTAVRRWDYFKWLDSGQSLIIGIGTFSLIYFSMLQFLKGEMTIGTLVFVFTVFVSLLGPMFSFVHGLREFYRVMADFDSLFQYYKIENEVKDKKDAREIEIKKGEINFEGISFSYGNRKIFDNLNLKIKANEKVALVGHSGCGKTTLVKLLYRFYDVNCGKVLVDGKDVKDIKQESLRSSMSVVPQECILFDDTVYNNIAFSNPKASRKEVLQAIKFAQLDKIIEKFCNKENTIVGERGIKLSGGEKQRVSIARAILANKKILVLDEATSSLDSETEHEIQKDLEELMKGRTSVIIAHRLSTIMGADRIIVMKNGKIVQEGKHNELIRKQGEYRKLWALQRGGYIK